MQHPCLSGCVKGFSAELESGLDAFFGKPALVHLQHIAHGFDRAVRVGGLRFHVCQIHNGAVIGYKGGGEWQHGVLHPEALLARLRENKKHALLLWHLFAKHEADLPLLRCLGHLGVNLVDARRQHDALQIRLRLVLRAS